MKEIAKKIASTPKKNTKRSRTVIITQGTDPTVAVTAKEGGDADVKEVAVHAIKEEQINDTNGAGDAHSGVLAAALARGATAAEAASRANASAALAVTRVGPATAPVSADIDRLLAQHRGS